MRLRYGDDIFATLETRGNALEILLFLNVQHPNFFIKLTIEHEEKNQLAFLDTSVIRRIGKFESTIYRSKKFTGFFLSLTASIYKISLIYCLAEEFVAKNWYEKPKFKSSKLFGTEVIDVVVNRFLKE